MPKTMTRLERLEAEASMPPASTAARSSTTSKTWLPDLLICRQEHAGQMRKLFHERKTETA